MKLLFIVWKFFFDIKKWIRKNNTSNVSIEKNTDDNIWIWKDDEQKKDNSKDIYLYNHFLSFFFFAERRKTNVKK